MMDEMQKTLARRRAQAEKKPDVSKLMNNIDENPTKIKISNYLRRWIRTMINLVGKNPIHYHTN